MSTCTTADLLAALPAEPNGAPTVGGWHVIQWATDTGPGANSLGRGGALVPADVDVAETLRSSKGLVTTGAWGSTRTNTAVILRHAPLRLSVALVAP